MAYLEPPEVGVEGEEKSATELRLIVTDPAEYEKHRGAQAMRRLATKPWRRT